MKPIDIQQSTVFDISPEILWKYLADTDQLNRNIGLPAVSFDPSPEPEKKGYYNAVTKFMGLKIRYEELPFDFITGDYYEVTRRFKTGPFEEIKGGIKLMPETNGTRLDVYSLVTPRNWIGFIIAHLALKRKATKDIVNYVKHLEQELKIKRDINAVTTLKPQKINGENLENRLNKLIRYPVNKDLVSRFEDYLRNSSELEVVQIRPYELAYQWGRDPMEVLHFCLYAVKAGVLDLIWHVLCPNCAVGTQDTSDLHELHSDSHCSTCQMKFDVDFAKSVEAFFRVNDSIRNAHKVIYCIGGPANMPQIQAQFRILPLGKRQVKVTFESGNIRIRSYHFKEVLNCTISIDNTAPTSLTVRATPEGLVLDQTNLKEGKVDFSLINDLEDEILIVIEHENYLKYTATAAQVTTLQGFRELFPGTALSPGLQVAFSDLVLLFTDLSGSTAMYETVGDSRAFEFVQNHFKYLTGIVRRNNGGIVKTMGDAIMASFISPKDAFQSALDMQSEWDSYNKSGDSNRDVHLKIGLHKGTAYAINEKDNQDYFGTMVNEAARIQSKAEGGDIVFSGEILEDPGVKLILNSKALTPEPFKAQLKGLVRDRTLYRIHSNL